MVDERDAEGDELVARAAVALREPVHPSADFDGRVMAEVRAIQALQQAGRQIAAEPVRETRLVPWILRPRTMRVSPLAGLAAAAAISAVTLLVPRMSAVVVPPVASTVASAVATEAATRATAVLASRASNSGQRLPIQFVLVAPDARSVSVAGSFNDWDTAATRLRRDAGGVWTVSLPLLAGRYTYSFVVDGTRWQADPTAPRSADDDFGAPSSVLMVAPH